MAEDIRAEQAHVANDNSEELARRREAAIRLFEMYLATMEKGICPQCGQQIQEKKQIGRSVYAHPCGHRLYQGYTFTGSS